MITRLRSGESRNGRSASTASAGHLLDGVTARALDAEAEHDHGERTGVRPQGAISF